MLKYILIAFKQQMSVIEKTVDRKLQIYLRESWTDTYTATNYAYKQSFDALNINAIREYLKDPIEYMTTLFNSDYAVYKVSLTNSILREIDEYYKNTKENLLKAVSEWSALFDPEQIYEQLQLSSFLLYLSGKSISSKEYNLLRTSMQRKHNINMNMTPPEYDFSEILKDVDKLLGSITIEKPVYFCELLCKSITEGDSIQNIWTDTERNESKKRMNTYLETKISYYNQIGCSARCPLCSSKCELPDDDHTQHQVTKHLLPAFNGCRNRETKYPSLIVCTEDKAHDERLWGYSKKDQNLLPLSEFLSKYHPSWLPFPRSEPSDEHITKMRAIWYKLKDELCKKHDMVDNTDPSWEFRYGGLIPE
ncbi:hypothetical protein GLOIN_2v1723021 [Rhizophagus irregularis DAOM 181602=DAOM 197198]|uniref:Uncharacterized protein n=6 Tax=Rhizophagus irregularis TaxID=588596 RepID=A0A2P4P1R0_RHIID|nr:hypothetical protein GLOIN_2v1723021 [Rhizophagus irregularis DAOM 181602=DAOM 197198]POG59298.1 hypothetical protein GLOIN_2v1723021 [Rhizophagus irregularis DAOM 181602=DAOM 197198]|eukprot:XP_025166164.1 hypothetical protein GLOIN_2v1723021 [Rhizophagus irregularis DAOM 181602=DAOM 197198]